MTIRMRIAIAMLALGCIFAGLEVAKHFGAPGADVMVAEAEAVVGRPLTPVSVAGVARRTSRRVVRRCAAGVTC